MVHSSHHIERSFSASCVICCTTAVSGNLDVWWELQRIWFVLVKCFYFEPKYDVLVFVCWHVTVSTSFKHPILEEVFVPSKFYAVSLFYYHKHCTSYGVSWQIQDLYAIKLLCLGKMIKKRCFVFSVNKCCCRHGLVHGSLTLCEARCTSKE